MGRLATHAATLLMRRSHQFLKGEFTKQERLREYNRLYRSRHREQVTIASKRRYRRRPNIMAFRIRQPLVALIQLHRQRIQELRRGLKRWMAAHPLRSKLQRKLYKLRHPEAVKLSNHRRRAHGKPLTTAGRMVQGMLQQIRDRQHGQCYWCHGSLTDCPHRDHVWPLSKGGSHGPENICFACPSCNLRKGDKSPVEFAGRLL